MHDRSANFCNTGTGSGSQQGSNVCLFCMSLDELAYFAIINSPEMRVTLGLKTNVSLPHAACPLKGSRRVLCILITQGPRLMSRHHVEERRGSHQANEYSRSDILLTYWPERITRSHWEARRKARRSFKGETPTCGCSSVLLWTEPHFTLRKNTFSSSFIVNSTRSQCPVWGRGFSGGSDGKESACNAGDLGSIPGLGRSPGDGKGYPLQYSCLENPLGQRSLAGH